MNSPYRGRVPDADVEPTAACEARPFWREIAPTVLLTLAMPLGCLLDPDRERAHFGFFISLPVLPITLALMLLERPMRAWLDRRYARMVVRGVAELEAKVRDTI